ncbi:MAG: hypothetical protein A2Z99_18775 [Treponema sp. GWB1_62_6]|nr:MAG: hypothetical protein A2Z99_18775 [Treponema sp. GWB1_62_6]OHE67283.1 MAG: hypothetical protein A2001_09720 [Treponema sp. GWC1_61_84]OHE75828.1 MAG: hypothetical protein A2413_11400 [Treponema sp. RIFOXYC1_FULL_61_9]HCM28841.1 hypothetical protein [Treponema sp.]
MKKAYRCEDCGSEVIQDSSMKAPDCCGDAMKEVPLESCMDPGPEATGGDEPCEDFTGKQK